MNATSLVKNMELLGLPAAKIIVTVLTNYLQALMVAVMVAIPESF